MTPDLGRPNDSAPRPRGAPDFAEVFMKLRRAMAVAAATAVIAPAALFSAPAAFASGNDTVTTTTESPSPSASETTTSPAPEESESSSTPATPPTAESGTPASPAASEEDLAPASSPPATGTSTTPAPGTSPSDEPSEGPAGCLDENGEVIFSKDLQTDVSGLPEKIVAGSGFHALKLNVTNKSDEDFKRVDFGAFASQLVDEETGEETGRNLTLQFKDPESGVWEDISLDQEDENYGYIGYTEVKAKQSYTIDLRLSVAKAAPAGLGVVFSIGLYSDGEGNCVIEDSDTFYEFEILGAGTDPGKPNEAEPQEGGKKPLPKPTGDNEIKPQGSLAETGSSSMVPVIGMAGGIAIVAGAGVVFAVRRRQGSAAA
ncbi:MULTISPECIES: LAETG motif-containing sortase-dependent surface protein [unclassified Streptomyces]|uniref:LAETG motif-containing sortase-dependent surface protein n=1 Tax=unclassified Streptomyces TaxID=2593676 RepID=UPI001F445D9F|nr:MULTISPECIES: LAETG motif-containing sortase-dependent surface protein [unclassified Streptomyces]